MSRSPILARRYFVRGRVQGVGFRYFVKQHATAIGVHGYTCNLDDGRVEVFAMGTKEQLDTLSGHLWKGPRMSEVRGVDEEEAAPESVRGFEIER